MLPIEETTKQWVENRPKKMTGLKELNKEIHTKILSSDSFSISSDVLVIIYSNHRGHDLKVLYAVVSGLAMLSVLTNTKMVSRYTEFLVDDLGISSRSLQKYLTILEGHEIIKRMPAHRHGNRAFQKRIIDVGKIFA